MGHLCLHSPVSEHLLYVSAIAQSVHVILQCPDHLSHFCKWGHLKIHLFHFATAGIDNKWLFPLYVAITESALKLILIDISPLKSWATFSESGSTHNSYNLSVSSLHFLKGLPHCRGMSKCIQDLTNCTVRRFPGAKLGISYSKLYTRHLSCPSQYHWGFCLNANFPFSNWF